MSIQLVNPANGHALIDRDAGLFEGDQLLYPYINGGLPHC
jgi:hypothetical protein